MGDAAGLRRARYPGGLQREAAADHRRVGVQEAPVVDPVVSTFRSSAG
jgi:hypothetical protein